MRPLSAVPALILAGIAVATAQAEEGMWTFNAFPFDKVEKAYGFRPDQAWLDQLRLSSLRLARGCSASFVSPRGLVQTNHHCARTCIEQLSAVTRNYMALGFYAVELKDESRCPDVEANQLLAITDVTDRIKRSTAGKDGAAFAEARKTESAAIEKECSASDPNIRCDVVALYHGGLHNLYKYRRYQDVRLVFAPEQSIAFFGGDPDNFEFPRYNLDVAYLRVYADDAPLNTRANFLRYAARDAEPGDLVFTSGHPAATNRLITVAELEFQRDVVLPYWIFRDSELRGVLTEFSARGEEQARIATDLLYGLENGLKARKGKFAALIDPTIIRARMESEKELRARIAADPPMASQYADAWDQIRTTLDRYRGTRDYHIFTEGGTGFRSKLFNHALSLVRYAAEARKADETRLKEYTEARFPITRQSLISIAPIYPELEKLTLAFSLTKMRETLGPDHAFVKKVLGRTSPAALAAELVDGSGLGSPELRGRLLAEGEAAIATSTDKMIAFVRMIDPDLRAARKNYEDDIEAAWFKHSGRIADARFKLYGASTDPDATFTLRISYGAVKGYRAGGRDIAPITTIGGAFDRATGSNPFKLPDSWIRAQSALNHRQPFNFATTNDIIGGNSGSPVVNRIREVVGLIFDGNIESLGGDYGYDPAVNRAVAVNVGVLRETLSKVYRTERLVAELAE